MSTTIDSLDIQIKTSAGASAANIEELAKALGQLRSNANLTKVTNNLTKLATALSALKSNSDAMYNLTALAGAMKSLASIQKPTGLTSAISTLKKLGEVTAGLDDAVIAAFTVKIRQLSDALEPLATRINEVAAGFKMLPKRVSSTVTAVNKLSAANAKAAASTKKHSDALDKQSINLAATIANAQAYVDAIRSIVSAVTPMIADAIEWDGIQFRFGRAFGEDAEEVYDYILKINDALKINTQQFMQYSSLYGSLLSGFGMQQDKVTTISVGLTELSYDIWAAYNDRYKTLEEASEAVRSAITGEIEPIRNAGIALTEASMQEYLDSIGQAHISIEKLTEAQKAEVRYAVMVNSAMNQGIVGTYAAEMHTAEGAVRTLSQQLKSLGQAIGSIFIPLLSAVIPYISAFVELLYEGVAALAAFFDIPFFEIDWGSSASGMGSGIEDIANSAGTATDALGDTADAAKKLKDYTMGFDELNVIDPTSASGGSGAGAGGGGAGAGAGNGWEGIELDTLWDESVFEKASEQVDELKAKIKGFFEEWKTEIAIIGGALGALSIAGLLSKLGEAIGLGDKFLGVMSKIKTLASTAIVITLQYSLMTEFLGDFMSKDGSILDYIKAALVGGIGTFLLYSMWGPAGLVIGLGVTAAASISTVIENGGINSVESATVALTGLASAIGAIAIAWKKLGPILKNSNIAAFFGLLKEGNSIGSVLAATFPKITGVIGKIGTGFGTAAKAVGTFVGGLGAGPLAAIVAALVAVGSAVYFVVKNWDKVKAAVVAFWETNIVPKLESIKESWNKIKTALRDAKEAMLSVVPPQVREALEKLGGWIQNIIDKFKEMGGLGMIFEKLGEAVFAVVGGSLAQAFSTVIQVIQGLIGWFSGVIQVISGIVEFVAALVTGGDLVEPWNKIKDGIIAIFKGLYDMTIGVVVNWVKSIIDWFTSLWDELVGHSIVPDMIDAIVEWFLSLPDKIFGPMKKFVDGIIQKFKDMWSSIKSWYSSNVAPKFTKSYWTGVFDKVKQGTSSKLQEVVSTVKEKWASIKTWFSGNVAPKFTKDYWLTKLKGLKDGFVQTIKNMVNSGIDLMNKFIGWLNEKLDFSWDGLKIAGKTVFEGGSVQLFTIPKIPKLEKGGILEDGLFTMNHGEIAGRFSNGQTVVANNQMIVEGISAGVYQAVVAAMNATNNRESQPVVVYLDGKQIYASVKKTESERGLSLMGNQLGYSY